MKTVFVILVRVLVFFFALALWGLAILFSDHSPSRGRGRRDHH